MITVGTRVQNKRYPSLIGRVTGVSPSREHFYVDYGVGNKTCLEPANAIRELEDLPLPPEFHYDNEGHRIHGA